MSTAWDAIEPGDLDLTDPLHACCHGSRVLGREPAFVLHGGGNTSVKAPWTDIDGSTIDTLYVKGSGWDLATIAPAGFSPLRRSRLAELLELDTLSDEAMARELAAAKLDPTAPAPSVESLLHAYLPFPAVLHSHADAIVAITNTADGEAHVRSALGSNVVVIPYVMPGFDLARLVRELWPTQYHDDVTGMVLLNHGLFTFATTIQEALARHVALIERCEQWIETHPVAPRATPHGGRATPVPPSPDPIATAELRQRISVAAGRPMVLTSISNAATDTFLRRTDWTDLASRGPLTPDHILRTKRLPLVGTDVEGYVEEYVDYFARHTAGSGQELVMVDPAPRVVLDSSMGMLTVGSTAAEASAVADIATHTIDVVATVEDRLGGYVALSEAELFAVEYWELEQAKLRRQGTPAELAGQVAIVTGAASGIGRACAACLLERGAAVVGIDVADGVANAFDGPAWLGIRCDVTDGPAVAEAVAAASARFGGLDIAVVAAGVLGATAPIRDLQDDAWRHTMSINVDSVATLFRSIHPYLACSPVAGRVVVIGSKNAPAPGRGVAPYSASKAALTQLARVAALEWADDGILVNVVHPDAVFDTGLWNEEMIETRARAYNMTPEAYRSRNLLGTEVTSAAVADLVLALCGPAFAATTGAQIPIDGGSDRII